MVLGRMQWCQCVMCLDRALTFLGVGIPSPVLVRVSGAHPSVASRLARGRVYRWDCAAYTDAGRDGEVLVRPHLDRDRVFESVL